MTTLCLYTPPLTDAVRARARVLLQPALDHAGDCEWQEVERRIDDRTATLWLAVNDDKIVAACVTEIAERVSGRWLSFWLTGGNVLRLYHEFEARIVSAARELGCIGATISGRPGWERFFPGYARTAITLERRF
jgi:hypothetical protein